MLALEMGFFFSPCICLPFGHFYLVELYSCMNSSLDWQCGVALIKIAQTTLEKFWSVLKQHTTSSPWFRPLALALLCTDACGRSWGAWLCKNSEAIEFSQCSWPGGSFDYSTLLKLRVVMAEFAILKFVTSLHICSWIAWPQCPLLTRSSRLNQLIVTWQNHWSCSSSSTAAQSQTYIYQVLRMRSPIISLLYLASQVAHSHVFYWVQTYLALTEDYFSSASNALLLSFNSFMPCWGARGIVDFGQLHWEEHVNWCYSPLALASQLIEFVLLFELLA